VRRTRVTWRHTALNRLTAARRYRGARICTEAVTICAFTSDPTDTPLIRLPITPNERNRLRSPGRLMVDKVTIVRRSKVRSQVGSLDDKDIVRLNRALLVFLGMASPPRGGRRAPEG
jgi:mRNA interferase MazF